MTYCHIISYFYTSKELKEIGTSRKTYLDACYTPSPLLSLNTH